MLVMVAPKGKASGILAGLMSNPSDMADPALHKHGVTRPLPDEYARWLACLARMAAAGKQAVKLHYGKASGGVVLGRGAGGDHTLELDRACERAMQEVLATEAPCPHLLISEEAGVSGPPDAPWRVVLDPVDGSLNAKRGLAPFAVSIAVADGPCLGDVQIGHVEDYLRPNVFRAVRDCGVITAGEPGVDLDPRRFESEMVEVVLLEAGRPDRHRFCYQDLGSLGSEGGSPDMRIRQIGSLALSLCYVAVGVADMLVAAVRARSVDLAAGLLVLSEAKGRAVTLSGEDLTRQPLDLERRCAFAAWRAGIDGDAVLARAEGLLRSLARSQ